MWQWKQSGVPRFFALRFQSSAVTLFASVGGLGAFEYARWSSTVSRRTRTKDGIDSWDMAFEASRPPRV